MCSPYANAFHRITISWAGTDTFYYFLFSENDSRKRSELNFWSQLECDTFRSIQVRTDRVSMGTLDSTKLSLFAFGIQYACNMCKHDIFCWDLGFCHSVATLLENDGQTIAHRDRHWRTRHFLVVPVDVLGRWFEPVSYTQLTLPTILLV